MDGWLNKTMLINTGDNYMFFYKPDHSHAVMSRFIYCNCDTKLL